MQTSEKKPLILTLRIDAGSQTFFDTQRKRYFPPERNVLNAHLSLFHQLPDDAATYTYLSKLMVSTFDLMITGLMNLGAGVAYRVESPALAALHRQLALHFTDALLPQDKQGFRPHVMIMNKSTPENARSLITELSAQFDPFTVQVEGLELWRYLGGPWEHVHSFFFSPALKAN